MATKLKYVNFSKQDLMTEIRIKKTLTSGILQLTLHMSKYSAVDTSYKLARMNMNTAVFTFCE